MTIEASLPMVAGSTHTAAPPWRMHVKPAEHPTEAQSAALQVPLEEQRYPSGQSEESMHVALP